MLYVHWLELENVPVVGVVILPVTVQPPGLELVGDVTLYVIRAASTGDEDIATTTAKATRAHELEKLFMRESPLVGSTTSWKGTKNRADGYGVAARERSPSWRLTSRLGSCPKA
jgi:hypothetical protein